MEYVVFGVVAAGLIVLLFAASVYNDYRKSREFVRELRQNYGRIHKKEYTPERFDAIAGYTARHPEEGQVDEITWNDLSLDEIFPGMNETYSSAGEEVLYHTLRTPLSLEEELFHREELIRFFSTHTDERVKLQVLFHKLGHTGRFSLYDYLDHLDILGKRSNAKHFVQNVLYIPAILLCFISPSTGVLALVGLMLFCIMTYFREKNEIDPYIISFAYVMRIMNAAEKMEKVNIPAIEAELGELKNRRKNLSRFRRGSFWLLSSGRMSGSGSPLDIVLDYLRMVFHLDLIKFNSMLDQVRAHTEDVDKLFYTLGYLEMTVAVGAYRASLTNGWCEPAFTDAKASLKGEELYHPLIHDPVKNSIEAKRGVLLTGSNASGKSTFLKTVAINAIFAQTIHTVLGDAYEASYFQICSSMALRDDLTGGESYYIVEIRAIKRILDIAVKGKNVLCFVDEVLRGTNTVERIAASTEILRSLSTDRTICFAATHDVELTDLLGGSYDNYHFEEEVEDGDVKFNYRLLNGKATTRNAIKLLGVMGYEDEIIQNANQRAEHFLQTGQWSLTS